MSQPHPSGGRVPRRLATVLACAAVTMAIAAVAPADARPPVETILQDDAALLHRPDAEVAASMKRLAGLGVDRVRLTAGWSVIAPDADSAKRPDFDAADPDAYHPSAWRNLDRAVRLAHAAGLEVMIDIAFWAPLWATSGDPNKGRARWNIDPAELALFSTALARRYSGKFRPSEKSAGTQAPPPQQSRDAELLDGVFSPPGGAGPLGVLGAGGQPEAQPSGETAASRPAGPPLPAVRWWTIWNEPNHPGFLQPQWEPRDGRLAPRSPHLYRALVRAAYPAVKAVQPASLVLVGGTSSTGAKRPSSVEAGVPPLRFLRELACVDRRLRPLAIEACRDYSPLPGDGFSHHPYSLLHRPDNDDRKNRDNVPIGSLRRLTRTLDRLVKMRRIDPRVADVYLTEFGYETNPPDPVKPFGLEEQARFINWAEYLAMRNPRVRSWPQFLLRDMGVVSAAAAAAGKRDFGDWQSGLIFHDGRPKPSLTSFKLALFACVERTGIGRKRTVRIWGHVRPGRGGHHVTLLQIPRGGASRALASSRGRAGFTAKASSAPFTTGSGGYLTRYARHRPGARYAFEHRTIDGATERSLAVAPVRCGR